MINPILNAITAAKSLLKSLKNEGIQPQFYETQSNKMHSLMNECSVATLFAEDDAIDHDILQRIETIKHERVRF